MVHTQPNQKKAKEKRTEIKNGRKGLFFQQAPFFSPGFSLTIQANHPLFYRFVDVRRRRPAVPLPRPYSPTHPSPSIPSLLSSARRLWRRAGRMACTTANMEALDANCGWWRDILEGRQRAMRGRKGTRETRACHVSRYFAPVDVLAVLFCLFFIFPASFGVPTSVSDALFPRFCLLALFFASL